MSTRKKDKFSLNATSVVDNYVATPHSPTINSTNENIIEVSNSSSSLVRDAKVFVVINPSYLIGVGDS